MVFAIRRDTIPLRLLAAWQRTSVAPHTAIRQLASCFGLNDPALSCTFSAQPAQMKAAFTGFQNQ